MTKKMTDYQDLLDRIDNILMDETLEVADSLMMATNIIKPLKEKDQLSVVTLEAYIKGYNEDNL